MVRRRVALLLGAGVLVLGGVAALLAWRPWDPVADVPVPGVRTLTTSARVVAGEPRTAGGVELFPVDVPYPSANPGGIGVEDAFALREAGAVAVRGIVEARGGAALVELAGFAAERGIAVSLETGDRTVRYDAYGGVPDVAAARLAVDAASRDGVDGAVYVASTEPHVQVSMTTAVGAPEASAVAAWLDRHDASTAVGHPVAYVLTEPGYAARLEGWVGGRAPAEPEPQPVPTVPATEPWPADERAPSCTGDDLDVSLAGVEAALGTRYASLSARNVSDRPCAVAGFPEVAFLDGDGALQEGVDLVPDRDRAARVVVPVGEEAVAALLWRAASGTGRQLTAALEVVPVPGAAPVLVRVGESPLDVVDGSEVRTSPWLQAGDGT
ncbi:DUF4232 domain-containing protein [Isoptericola variabilis]|uniref:DUF4232 domain-containing protein n=1 Tax=Isoptericola variabilis (strain 225) TaxID=743718 RepID=F6FUI1_ISOV2|nr:DUF4232 domain-containing protein [Isoptericola variabilis]AEG45408.1 hypothetical protein Isova_2709 [Isoptericola variabilis 225]TWH28136.1 uncharacterized protein DUF4232 [Isoptericola variabilis J7]